MLVLHSPDSLSLRLDRSFQNLRDQLYNYMVNSLSICGSAFVLPICREMLPKGDVLGMTRHLLVSRSI